MKGSASAVFIVCLQTVVRPNLFPSWAMISEYCSSKGPKVLVSDNDSSAPISGGQPVVDILLVRLRALRVLGSLILFETFILYS